MSADPSVGDESLRRSQTAATAIFFTALLRGEFSENIVLVVVLVLEFFGKVQAELEDEDEYEFHGRAQ
jgi:hypothetical protein